MPALKGNDYNLKFRTKSARRDLCKKICAHLENGFNQKSFPYASWKTVKRYIENYPEDFPPDRIARAERIGRFKWEKIGHDLVSGKIRGNSTIWAFNMMNKYGWKL